MSETEYRDVSELMHQLQERMIELRDRPILPSWYRIYNPVLNMDASDYWREACNACIAELKKAWPTL